MPVRVARLHQGRTHLWQQLHGDDITIGRKRSAVEFRIRMMSRKYEIKKQVIGEDADFEKSGRILNRVIERGRDGITTEADQRHVRELVKDLVLEQENRSATPCAVESKNEGDAVSDESKGENRCEHRLKPGTSGTAWVTVTLSDADWGGDKATRRSVSAWVIMRVGHCLLNVWTEKHQVVSLSPAESELHAAFNTASEGLGIQSVANDLGKTCGLNLRLDASATMCLVNRRGLGKAKHVDMQSVDTGGIQVRQVRHKAGRHEREPSRLNHETAAETENRAAHFCHGLRVHDNRGGRVEVTIGENMMCIRRSRNQQRQGEGVGGGSGQGCEQFLHCEPIKREVRKIDNRGSHY